MKQLSLYIHWPFCLSKCPYCDFNSFAVDTIDSDQWRAAYVRELDTYAHLLPDHKIQTIYFGGGTPSLMEPSLVGAMIDHAAKSWSLSRDCEITLEANPTSSDADKFAAFRAVGVNRLSLGVQSFDSTSLKQLGRTHSVREAEQAIALAQDTFPRFSFDLIYARAGQTEKAWERELKKALSFSPRHLSLYQLTLEPGSAFYKRKDRTSLILADEAAADLYAQTSETLSTAGLFSYEVSNYAVPGDESRHNLAYWHYADYIGIGAGAHGGFFKEGHRATTRNHKNPTQWATAVQSKGTGVADGEALNQSQSQTEALLMGLRLTRGIDKARWRALFGEPFDDFISASKKAALATEGLIIDTDDAFRTTDKGRLSLDAVLSYLM